MNAKIPKAQLDQERISRRAGSHKTDRPLPPPPKFLGGLSQSVNDACQAWLEKRGLALPSADFKLGFNLARSREFKAFRAQEDAKRAAEETGQ